MDEQQPSRMIRAGTAPVIPQFSVVPPALDLFGPFHEQVLRSVTAALGLSFEQLSEEYDRAAAAAQAAEDAFMRRHMLDVFRALRRGALVKAERLCDEAGFRAAQGQHGMGRKMKRARRLFEQCYSAAYSRDNAQARFRSAYIRGMTARLVIPGRYVLMAGGYSRLKDRWKGPGRGYLDPAITDPPWDFSR